MTLLELLERYNFRYCHPELDITNADRDDSCIVRIYFNEMNASDWFEIGVNDWSDNEAKIRRLKYFIKERVLNKQVYSFNYNEDVNVLCITLMPDIYLAKEE